MSEHCQIIQQLEDLEGLTILKVVEYCSRLHLKLSSSEQPETIFLATIEGGMAWDADYIAIREDAPSDDILVEFGLLSREQYEKLQKAQELAYEQELLARKKEQYEKLKKELGYV